MNFEYLLSVDQINWCNNHLKNWSVDENGFVNVKGSVLIPPLSTFTRFPVLL